MKNPLTTWTSLITTLLTVVLGILVATGKLTAEQNSVLSDLGNQLVGAVVGLIGIVQGIIGVFSAKDEVKKANV